MIKKGDIVKIKPEWQDKGDNTITFIAVDNEEKGKVQIEALIGFSINPRYTVLIEMLD